MGLIKTGIIAGTTYAVANKAVKAYEKKKVPAHGPCNCPYCPFSANPQMKRDFDAQGQPFQQQSRDMNDQQMQQYPQQQPGGHAVEYYGAEVPAYHKDEKILGVKGLDSKK